MSFAARLIFVLCLPTFIAPLLSAQNIAVSRPTLWASKPDVPAFEKIENDHLAAGREAIDTLIAVKGPRTLRWIAAANTRWFPITIAEASPYFRYCGTAASVKPRRSSSIKDRA